jgi:NADPH-dependent 2,4-dienoyl-CoA reductase/sulfur reductase-like enzyme
MASTQYLLVGAGLASGQAAKELRRQDSTATITMIGDEPHPPYDRPPLSKEYLRGEKPVEQLFFDTEQALRDLNIALLLGTPVRQLHADQHAAVLSDGRIIEYRKALLATGGRPLRLAVPGGELPHVHYLRTLEDASALAAEARPGREALIVGAGFIGLEVAASLTQRGVRTTVLEAQDRIWPRFADAGLARYVQDYCAQKGVAFRTSETVTRIEPGPDCLQVHLRSSALLPCDFVCIGVGIVPNVTLAQQAGLAVQNGIRVDEYLQTSNPDIYAAGDVANYFDPLFGKQRRVEHWGHAEYSGQLAAQNMAGARRPYDLLTYVWSDLFDLHLEFAGDESEHDRVLTRGGLGDRSFMVLYLKRQVLRAYFAVNPSSKELPPLQRLIHSRRDLSGKESALEDPSVALKSLLAP